MTKKIIYTLFIVLGVASCNRVEIPELQDNNDGTRTNNDSTSVENGSNGVSITIVNDGEWGGITEI